MGSAVDIGRPFDAMNARRRLLSLPLLLASLLAMPGGGKAMAEGGIEVHNTAGQSMTVEVLAHTESSGNVRINRLPDGQIFNLKITMFDEASQKAIAEAAPALKPRLRVDVSVGRRRAREGDSSYRKTQDITVTVKVRNDSRDIDLATTRFTVLLVGRNMLRYSDDNADTAKVLAKEEFTKDLAAGKELEYECAPVTTSYDSDRDSSNIGGWEYDGYLLVLQDETGRVIDAYSNVGPVEVLTLKDPALLKAALALPVDKEVQRSLVPLNGVAPVLK